jgi:predicted nucleic acid-binding protein
VIAYLDSSVILRIVLGENDPLRDWTRIERGVTSILTRIETARVLDRARLVGGARERDLEAKQREIREILLRLDIVPIDEQIMAAAARPMESVLGTLDAIHLATASVYRAKQPDDEPPIVFTTHDRALGVAANMVGFHVIGT